MILSKYLQDVASSDQLSWQPRLFDPSIPQQLNALERLLAEGQVVRVHDEFEAQLAELVETRNPSRSLDDMTLQIQINELLRGEPSEQCGVWVYYPWSRVLVHILAQDDFRELRSNRNRNKISWHEQAQLRNCTIAIVGLSVGQASALTMAMEGVGGRFILADFDELSLSNMNRLRASIGDIGVNKCVLAARQMFETDPFLDIELFVEGATSENIDALLGRDTPIDLLVEECDSLHIKVMIREHARRRRIPVVMETSDRGLIDVERFDLEPDRPLFHGLIGDVDTDALAGLSTKDKLPFVLRLLGETAISDRLAGSLFSVEDTLKTWPQLGSAVTLGGATATNVARRILLGELEVSGRFYVDLDQLVCLGAEVELNPPVTPYVEHVEHVERRFRRREYNDNSPVTDDEIRVIVEHALMAPSAGNAQPWRFRFANRQLDVSYDPTLGWSFLDYGRGATHLTFGAAYENIELAAGALGLRCKVDTFRDLDKPHEVFSVSFERDATVEPNPLVDAISRRATNRRHGDGSLLAPEHRQVLEREALHHGVELRITSASKQINRLASAIGKVDRMAFLNRRMHSEIMSEFRWNPEDAVRTRDGIDLATLDLSRSDAAVFRMLAHWPGMAFLKRMGGSGSLEKPSRKALTTSSAVAVLTIPGMSPSDYLNGGRAMERVWLAATLLDIQLQPMAMLPYLLARLEHGEGEGLDEHEVAVLLEARDVYREVFPRSEKGTDAMLFRVFYAPPPSTRALRRLVDESLVFE